MQIWLIRKSLPTESTSGSSAAAATTSQTPDDDTRRRKRSAVARTVVAAPCSQVLRSPVRAPLRSAPTRTSSTTMIRMKMMSCCFAGDATFHWSSSRNTPMPTPATKATVRLIMAPISAAVSA